MTLVQLLIVGVGGFSGAILRYLISVKMNRTNGYPVGTLVVNLVGSFTIGLVIGWGISKMLSLFLVSGLLGSLTTFSTINKEMIEIWRAGNRMKAIQYGGATYLGGLIIAFIGYTIGR